jgi:homoserine O-succinyltransferase
MRFIDQETEQYPPFPEHYFNTEVQAVFSAYAEQVKNALKNQQAIPTFPEQNIEDFLDNTWRDSAKAVFNNWLGKVYQITNQDRRLPFMQIACWFFRAFFTCSAYALKTACTSVLK